MGNANRATLASCWMLLAIAWPGTPVFAQGAGGGGAAAASGATCDMSGEWSARSREDYEDRAQMGTHLGDYTGFPINDAARQYGRTWDAGILSLPTQQGLPHPGQYIMRGPGPNVRMSKVIDERTQDVVGYSVVGVYGRNDRMIWTDGRPHPPEFAEYTWSGFSTGVCERGMLKVVTTHNKFGYHRRNGVPASIKSKMTEYFIRHGDTLTHVQFTEDPVYLTEPLVRTTDFELNRTQNVGGPGLGFETVEEVTSWPKGYVPHFPFDTVPDEFAREWGIPFEAAMGGAETIYPEYLQKLKKLIAEQKAKAAAAPAARAPAEKSSTRSSK
jgi:hypothetical protein